MLELAANAATTGTVDPLLTLIGGAVGAALIGLLGAWIQSRREHAKWLREQRMTLYLDFLREAEKPPGDVDPAEYGAYLDDLGIAYAAIELVGPDRVMDAAREHFFAVMDYTSARDARAADIDEEKFPSVAARKAEDDKRAAGLQRETERQSKTRRAFVVAARKQLAIKDRPI